MRDGNAPPGCGPDGLAIGREGGLTICHIGLGTIWQLNPRGEIVRRVASPEGLHTTNAVSDWPVRKRDRAPNLVMIRATDRCRRAGLFARSIHVAAIGCYHRRNEVHPLNRLWGCGFSSCGPRFVWQIAGPQCRSSAPDVT